MTTVKLVKALVPLAEVHELKPGTQYLVTVNERLPMQAVEQIAKQLEKLDIKVVLVDHSLTFYEVEQVAVQSDGGYFVPDPEFHKALDAALAETKPSVDGCRFHSAPEEKPKHVCGYNCSDAGCGKTEEELRRDTGLIPGVVPTIKDEYGKYHL